MLSECSIIVTSRPTSSADIQALVSAKIQICGFTRDDLNYYFTTRFQKGNPDNEAAESEAAKLLQRIKGNPMIEGFCYLPLNASILVFLYNKGENKLPTTQYEIFTDLVRHCIRRHQQKTLHNGCQALAA